MSVLRLAGKWFSPFILSSYVDVQRRHFHLRKTDFPMFRVHMIVVTYAQYI